MSYILDMEFSIIFFPLYSITQDEFLGCYKNESWCPGLLELATSGLKDVVKDNDVGVTDLFYERRLIP